MFMKGITILLGLVAFISLTNQQCNLAPSDLLQTGKLYVI